jgi:hypothetical protein
MILSNVILLIANHYGLWLYHITYDQKHLSYWSIHKTQQPSPLSQESFIAICPCTSNNFHLESPDFFYLSYRYLIRSIVLEMKNKHMAVPPHLAFVLNLLRTPSHVYISLDY